MKRFCGFITGFVFFIGGILKLLDPVGAGLVMKEYFDFLHIGFMDFMSKPAGTIMAFAETVIGAALITGVWRRLFGTAAIVFQIFFTALTLLLVIFNPAMDCGCFGEAIHLTHMETFIKNIILCILLCIYYFPTRQLGQNKKRKYVSFAIVTISSAVFMVYSWMYIPIMDFTEFKPATALQAGHAFATDGEDIYESVFIYEKNGKEESFNLSNLPDSSWTFIRTETQLKEGYGADKTAVLSFYDEDGAEMDSVAVEGKVLVISVYEPEAASARWAETADFVTEAERTGFTPLILAASSPEQAELLMKDLDTETRNVINRHLLYSDYKTLITMNRSNGGVTYFSDGYLIRKWARRNRPDAEELQSLYYDDETESIIGHDTNSHLGLQGFLLYVFAVMLLL